MILCLELTGNKIAALLQEVKEYIRRAKIWRNENWKKDEKGRPSSYLMSLLVVAAFEIASSNDGYRYANDSIGYAVKSFFPNHSNISAVFLFSSKQLSLTAL